MLHRSNPEGGGTPKYDLDVAELWNLIRFDTRFITQFIPREDPDGLRNPRILQVDGEYMPRFAEELGQYEDVSPEYAHYCAEADKWEAEVMEELRASRERSGGKE